MSIHDHLPNVARRASGRPTVPTNWRRWEPRAFCAQGGSKNESHLAYAAAGDFRWIGEVARLQCEEFGLCLDELGAGQEFYGIAPRVGEMLSLRLALKAGDTESAHWIARVLRSYWHWLALGSLPVAVHQGWQMIGLGGQPRGREVTAKGNAGFYSGVTCTLVGDRWKRGSEGGEPYGAFLAWAAGWQPRSFLAGGKQPKMLGVRARDGGLSLDVIANLGGVSFYHEEITAATFGLQPGDRERLRAVVNGDAAAADEAAAIVMRECPPHPDYAMTRIRRAGAAESISERVRNGNGGHCAYSSIAATGFRQTLLPADFQKIGSDAIWVRVHPDKIEAGDSDSHVEAPRPGGAIVYGYRFHGGRVEQVGGGEVTLPPAPPPPPPPPPPPKPPGPKEPPVPPPSDGPPIPGDGHNVAFRLPGSPGEGISGVAKLWPNQTWTWVRWKRDKDDDWTQA